MEFLSMIWDSKGPCLPLQPSPAASRPALAAASAPAWEAHPLPLHWGREGAGLPSRPRSRPSSFTFTLSLKPDTQRPLLLPLQLIKVLGLNAFITASVCPLSTSSESRSSSHFSECPTPCGGSAEVVADKPVRWTFSWSCISHRLLETWRVKLWRRDRGRKRG